MSSVGRKTILMPSNCLEKLEKYIVFDKRQHENGRKRGAFFKGNNS